jgi:asparagine synthase (glutamine-hydrolysing)
MCGICGHLAFNNGEPDVNAVGQMTDRLLSRGPDDHGVHVCGNVALGHRRLKIIDLSARSKQPMIDDDLGLTIVYNGALYNYRKLKRELEHRGYSFFSDGDTEVILKAYHAWGEDCVKRFNGMFAFAIACRDTGELFLARDRLGIKPLYFTQMPGWFRFASTLPAMTASGGIDTEIDPVALHHYMSFHAVVPSPHTIFKGVSKLPPATTMIVKPNGDVELDTYWTLSFNGDSANSELSFEDWTEQVLVSLRRAVERRLIADVPVGVLLSGGVDSSLVVGLLAELGQPQINTFSIGFDGVGGEPGNEFEYSDIVAREFGTDHHKIKVDSGEVLTSLQPCIAAMSEPMVSHDCIGFYLLSRAVSQHVKVVQSGQGADEIFGGYHWYPKMIDSEDAVIDYVSAFCDRSHTEYATSVDSRFVGDDFSLDFVQQHFAAPGADTPVDRALRIDTTVMLVDDPVKRVDNMTMAWGLEARVPFLDHELVELAARIPARHKLKNGGKHVLKEAARSVVPDTVIDRPKGYFPVPALKRLRGDTLAMVEEILLSPESKRRKLFNATYIERLLKNPDEHLTPLRGSKLWQMALLEFWLDTQGD